MLGPRGQAVLLSTIVLAALVLAAIAALRHPRPRCAGYVGELQSAELVHAARLYWEIRSRGGATRLEELLSMLHEYSAELRLGIPNVSYALYSELSPGKGGWGVYRVQYNNSVSFAARWNWSVAGYYAKMLRREKVAYVNLTLYYVHEYAAPQWGLIRVSPPLRDPAGMADLERRGGRWIVGIPVGLEEYALEDSYGIRIVIRVG